MCLIFCLRSNSSQGLERNTLWSNGSQPLAGNTRSVCTRSNSSQALERNTTLIQRLTSTRKKHNSDPTAHKRSKETQLWSNSSQALEGNTRSVCFFHRFPPSSSRNFSLYICRLGRHCHITSKLTLQGFRSIATKFIATPIVRCNKMTYYHKILIHCNRIYIFPQFRFVALSTAFVAIEATYCHKLHQRCNMVVILRQLRRVAGISHFVAIKNRYCNKLNLCGNIFDRYCNNSDMWR